MKQDRRAVKTSRCCIYGEKETGSRLIADIMSLFLTNERLASAGFFCVYRLPLYYDESFIMMRE